MARTLHMVPPSARATTRCGPAPDRAGAAAQEHAARRGVQRGGAAVGGARRPNQRRPLPGEPNRHGRLLHIGLDTSMHTCAGLSLGACGGVPRWRRLPVRPAARSRASCGRWPRHATSRRPCLRPARSTWAPSPRRRPQAGPSWKIAWAHLLLQARLARGNPARQRPAPRACLSTHMCQNALNTHELIPAVSHSGMAYDYACVRRRGARAFTNFSMSRYLNTATGMRETTARLLAPAGAAHVQI
jgi:hypothetical protein